MRWLFADRMPSSAIFSIDIAPADGISRLAGLCAREKAMKQNEFEALITDKSKVITGDISWSDDEDHSPSVEFRAEVASDAGYPLFVRGSYNSLAASAMSSFIKA